MSDYLKKQAPVKASGLVCGRTRKGLVAFELEGHTLELPPKSARYVAKLLCEAAEGAETAELLLEILVNELGLSDLDAISLLEMLRKKREQAQESSDQPFLN
jgi:hypothetical protein